MKREELENLITSNIASQLGVEEFRVTADAHLFDDLGADSLDLVELALEFEEMFKVTIPDDDLEQINTVGELIEGIERMIDEQHDEETVAEQTPPEEPDEKQDETENDNSDESGEDNEED